MNFVIGTSAILVIPLAFLAYSTGNAMWLLPLLFTIILLVRRAIRRRGRTHYDDILADPELHEKLKTLPNYAETMEKAKSIKSLGY